MRLRIWQLSEADPDYDIKLVNLNHAAVRFEGEIKDFMFRTIESVIAPASSPVKQSLNLLLD
jgi:hypothetical protein